MRILIIEDDHDLRNHVQRQLQHEGYRIEVTGDGKEGLYLLTEYPFDAAIVDIGLPGLSGLDVVKKMRQQGNFLPVLMLTARGRWQERVEGLEAGADDYLAKPFEMPELSARLKALMRRAAGAPQSVMYCGYFAIHLTNQQVLLDGVELELTSYEYRLLEYLAKKQGRVVSKDELRDYLYPHDTDPESNVLTVLLSRLRRKLDPHGTRSPIETLHGRGYRLNVNT